MPLLWSPGIPLAGKAGRRGSAAAPGGGGDPPPVYDNFARTGTVGGSTLDSGGTWSAVNGVDATMDGAAVVAPVTNSAIYSTPVGSVDGTAKIELLPGATHNVAVGRISPDLQEMVRLTVRSGTEQYLDWLLQDVTGGVFTTVTTGGPWDPNTTEISLKIDGSQATVYIDGVAQGTWTVSQHAVTTWGFFISSIGTGAARIDYFDHRPL